MSFVGLLALACSNGNPSDGQCGNAIVDPGEVCDDGNTVGGDGCSENCLSEEDGGCGDGIVGGGEDCDDGNTEDGDGCSANCQSEDGPRCGDNNRDFDEECDDGNRSAGDGCDASCRREDGGPDCGNGVIDAGEECDDGNQNAGDGCDSGCALEPGTCGDGVRNSGEDCDDGNTLTGDGCSSGCLLEGAVCGNSIVESGEDCDDGNLAPNDGCSPVCLDEACGDGIVQPDEECDDGNTNSGDGCDNKCDGEGAKLCGNGVLETGEFCDDGNKTPGDGCDQNCFSEPLGFCAQDFALFCDTVDTWSTTLSGSTDDVYEYSCAPWVESGREYAYAFVAPTSSAVTISLHGTSADLDVFVLEDGNLACDPDSCLAFGDNQLTFQATAGSLYYVVIDGYFGAESAYSVALTCGVCGDGVVDPAEQCDDGNTAGGDGCNSSCRLEGCGNGKVDVGEECDDGNTDPGDGCDGQCRDEECGNGTVDAGEQCDDGNTGTGDGCDAQCQLEGGQCTPDHTLTCGDSDGWSTTLVGSTDEIDNYSCVPFSETGREYAYQFTAPQTGDVTVRLSGLDSDLDIFVVGDNEGACVANGCIGFGNNQVTFSAVQGETYYLIVDGFLGAQGDFDIEVSCGGGTCGDGVLNAREEGVAGGIALGDGCDNLCHQEATCSPATTIGCGTSDDWSTLNIGATDDIDQYSCVSWNESGPEYAYAFFPTSSGQMTVSLTPDAGLDLDMFMVQDPGTGCAASDCVSFGDNTMSFFAVSGQTYYIVVDGFQGDAGGYQIDFSCP